MPSSSVEIMSSIPNEILEEIFLRLDARSLLNICTVCSFWSSLVQTKAFWKRKISYDSTTSTTGEKTSLPKSVLQNTGLSWKFFASICFKNGYSRNLIVNGSGEEVGEEELENQDRRKIVDGFTEPWPDYPGWTILSSGGSGWRLEKSPDGQFPDELKEKSFFCTSFHSCTKEQIVSLKSCGIMDEIMDNYQPNIAVKDYYSKSEGYGGVYEIKVSLLDSSRTVIMEKSFRDDMRPEEGTHWRKMEHVFCDYGVGARYVRFYHGGSDTAMKEGWFGSKMTGSSVVVAYP